MEMWNLIVDYYYTCALLSLTSCLAIFTGGEGEDVFADKTHWPINSQEKELFFYNDNGWFTLNNEVEKERYKFET